MVRTSTLSFAASLSATIPLYNIADNMLSLVENRPQHREYGFKVVSVSLLNLVRQAVCTTISESHKRLLKAYVIRLAHCAALEVQVNTHTYNVADKHHEDAKSAAHAAMDLLAVACMASAELEKTGQQHASALAPSPQLALRSLLSSLCVLQAAEVQLDNGTEREICRRIKSMDFPSLAEESVHSVVGPLISAIQTAADMPNVNNLKLEATPPLTSKKTSSTGSGKSAGYNSSLSEVLADSDSSPTNSSSKHATTTRRSIANIRKSWSTSVDAAIQSVDNADNPEAAAKSVAAQFSPPKLTAARSFHGSPTASAPLSARGTGGVGESLASKSEASRSAYLPSWSAGKTTAEKERTEPLSRGRSHISGRKVMDIDEPKILLETQSSKYGSTGEMSLASSSSLQSHSNSMQSLGLSIRDPHNISGRSQLGESFDEDQHAGPGTAPHGTERMGRSLRLLKSPQSRHQLTLSAESDNVHSQGGGSAVHGGGRNHHSDSVNEHGYSYYEDPSRTPYELNSASNESCASFSPYVPSGRRGPTASMDAQDEGISQSATQSFDSASKARLKRTRLKSANAVSTSVDAVESDDQGSNTARMHSPRIPTGRHVASRSETGLDKQLNNDDRPIGGAHQRTMSHGYNYSSENLNGHDEFQDLAGNGAPSPVKRFVGRRNHNKTQNDSAPAESPSTNLSDVTSVILKPDTTYDYIPSEEITPCTNPVPEMNKAYKGLETQDWPEIFHTLNTFRKLALHHPLVLVNAGTLHNVVLLVMKRVDALRSSLAKNALLTIDDMLRGLGKHIDAEVATILPGILKVI